MIIESTYRKSFLAAITLHFCLALLLLTEASRPNPVMVNEAKNEPGEMMPIASVVQPQKEIVKAVSINNQEVMATVNRLKQEKAQQLQAENSRQQALVKQANMARQERLREQQRLSQLKDEAAKLALTRKKQIEEEQKKLEQLALQKEQETKRLEQLKTKQQELKSKEDAEKINALKKKALEEKALAAKNEKLKTEALEKAKVIAAKAQADTLAAAEQAKQQAAEAAAQQARQNAVNQARVAGEVDKYKAMIVNAIGRQWILPDNANRGLSSQFRIRLAPDGAVLEVSLIRSSGDAILDRSAQTAIYKASPLPVPTDPTTFDLFRDISLTVRPENVRG